MTGLTIQTKAFLTLGITILILIKGVSLLINKRRSKKVDIRREFVLVLFIVYIISLIGVTLFPVSISWVQRPYKIYPIVNLIPLKFITIGYGVSNYLLITNLLGNLFLLTPLGILMPILWYNKINKLKSVIFVVFFVSLTIEILQFIEMYFQLAYSRATDINDLILNVLGGILGYMIFYNLFKKYADYNLNK